MTSTSPKRIRTTEKLAQRFSNRLENWLSDNLKDQKVVDPNLANILFGNYKNVHIANYNFRDSQNKQPIRSGTATSFMELKKDQYLTGVQKKPVSLARAKVSQL